MAGNSDVGSKVLGVICARGGSKGLRLKNLRRLGGETLLSRAIRHAHEADCLDAIIVSTDDDQIALEARRAGAIVPFVRPTELAGDLSTTEVTLQHAILTYEAITGVNFDIGVFLTATDIFRKPNWIRDAVGMLRNRPELESVFVGYKTHKNFWERREDGTWVRLRDWMAIYGSRQVRRPIVREDTGLACASRAQLWRNGRRIGDNIEIILTDDDFTAIDIHHEEDLFLAEAALRIRGEV